MDIEYPTLKGAPITARTLKQYAQHCQPVNLTFVLMAVYFHLTVFDLLKPAAEKDRTCGF